MVGDQQEQTGRGAGEGRRQPPRPQMGAVLHQRRGMPAGPVAMAMGGFVIVAAIGYFTLFVKSKPEAKAVAGSAK